MQSVLDTLQAFAQMPSPLLLLGESGTGKTRLAQWCHQNSSYRDGPFITASLYDVPSDQARARLFGVVRGAYSDAVQRSGFVEQAEGGTLFIDEVGDLDQDLQMSLMRLVDEQRYHQLGETTERQANIRIITSTNVDLRRAVLEQRFRGDLLSRLDHLAVEIPPMRERLEEVPAWVTEFAKDIHHRAGSSAELNITAEAELALRQIPFEGNLRGLRSLVERAYAFARARAHESAVTVSEADVRRAAGLASPTSSDVLGALREAAQAYLGATENSETRPGFEHLKGVFEGMVLRVALRQLEDPKEVARRLGFADRIRGGNHHDTLRRFTEKLEKFSRMLESPNALDTSH